MPEPSGETAYLFRHGLLRDAAYELYLPAQRAALHLLVLRLLDAALGADPTVAAELAEHSRQAAGAPGYGELEAGRRVEYLLAAGKYSAAQFHNIDAARMFTQAASLAECPPEAKLRALLEAGTALRLGGRQADARAALQSAREHADRSGNLVGAANARGNLGVVEREVGNLEAAAQLFREASQALESLDPAGATNSRMNLAVVLADRGEFKAALDVSARCEQECRQRGDTVMLCKVLANKATSLDRSGDLVGAMAAHLEALELARRHGDRKFEAQVHQNMSITLGKTGEAAGASAAMAEALVLTRTLGSVGLLGHLLANHAVTFFERHEFDRAQDLLQQALEYSREGGRTRTQGVALTNLGRIALARNDYSRAAGLLFEALSANRAAGNRSFEGLALEELAAARLGQGDLAGASYFAQQAMDLYGRMGDHQLRSFGLCLMARLALLAGNAADALENLVDAGTTAGAPLEFAVAGGGLKVRALAALGRLDDASLELAALQELAARHGDDARTLADEVQRCEALLAAARAGDRVKSGYLESELPGALAAALKA